MAPPTRWVVVDDTTPDIVYSGSWVADVGSLNNIGNFGPPYLNTLHGTNSSVNLSFNFSGTRIRAWGTNLIRNDSGVIDPQWECFVDNVSIGSAAPFQYPENNWGTCPETPVKDGHHTLTIQTAVAKNQTFWIDRIDYAPSPSLSLENKTILVPHSDAAIQFDNAWGNFGDFAKGTQQNGAVMTFNFYGVSIGWWGYSPGEFPSNSTTATWQIDNEPVQTFLVRGHGGGPDYNIKFFETPSYPYGSHRLTVIHGGNGQSTPLNLVSLLIQNGTSPGSGVAATPSASATPKSTQTALIIGVVAGAVVLVLAVLLFIMFRRRMKSKKERADVDPVSPEPYLNNPISRSTNIPDHSTSNWGNHPGPRMASQIPPMKRAYRNTNQHTPTDSYGGEEVQSVEQSSDSMSQSLPHLHGDRSPRRRLKAQETEVETPAASSAQIPQSLHSGGTLSDYSSSNPIPGPPRIVVHQDSGLRMQRPPEAPVIDIPPQYTPG